MALINVNKNKAVVEDLELGMSTVEQARGTGTQVNAGNLPYSATETTTEAIDRKEDITAVDAKLATKADLNGNSTEVFEVDVATTDDQAPNKGQMDLLLADKADISYVDNEVAVKADEVNVLLKDGTSPIFTPVSENQPTTKKYVDDLIIDAGAGDMLKSVYDTGNTGAVDTSEAIGRIGTFLGETPMTQIMRLSQSNVTDCNILDDMGIFIGTDAANAPTSGMIGLEQLSISSGTIKAQRCFSFLTNLWYDRQYNGTIWSGWSAGAKLEDVVQKTGDTMTGQLKGITPVAPEDMVNKQYVDNLGQTLITQNHNVLVADFALADGFSGVVTSGMEIADGVTLTIPDGSTLSVV